MDEKSRLRSTPNLDLLRNLVKSYSPLAYRSVLTSLLKSIYPSESFQSYSKRELHELLNELIIGHHGGEQTIKYKLMTRYFSQTDVVGALEIKANSSRADFLAINGHTSCFEIKSRLDNLLKVRRQVEDYSLLFDYITLVVDKYHLNRVLEMLPIEVGLWSYDSGNLKIFREAVINTSTQPEVQLNVLSKRELLSTFPEFNGCKKTTVQSIEGKEINKRFRNALKKRYYMRWNFLAQNHHEILPADFQFFFQVNLPPSTIYA